MRSNSSIHGISGIQDGLAAVGRFNSDRANQKMQSRSMELREDAYKRDKDLHDSKMENQELVKHQALGAIAAKTAMILEGMDVGEPSPEEAELMKMHPTLSADYINSPEVDKAISTYEALKAGKLSMSSPEVVEAVNIISPEVNLGAADGRARKVTRIVPGPEPGTLSFGLSVEGDPQERPLTERRSSDPNDPVKLVKLEDIIGKVEGLKRYKALLNSKQGRQALIKAYAPATKSGSKETFGPMTTDPKTGMHGQFDSAGKFHPVDQRKKGGGSSRSGGGGTMPNDAKMIEYLQSKFKSEGKKLSTEQAHKMIKLAASSPDKYVSDYVGRMVDLQEYAPEEEKKSLKELEREALDSYERIRSFSYGDGNVKENGSVKENGNKDNPSTPDEFLDEYF